MRSLLLSTPFALSAEQVADGLDVHPATGLSQDEAAQRLQRHGPNRLRRQKPVSVLALLAHQFRSLIVWLLVAASVFSLVIGDHAEAIAIVVVLLLNGGIGFFTELRAARSMEALLHFAEVRTRVRRDGHERMIDARDLVPGDVVVLDGGDVVTADLRLVRTANMQADESVLTGESAPVLKSVDPVAGDTVLGDRSSMVFKGTGITRGTGEAVVVATGMDTELGRISKLAQEAQPETSPLEHRLERLGRTLIWVTLVMALGTVAAGVLRGQALTDMIQTGVALAVAAIPEGLPVVATLSLARGMWRMAARNALIRRLSAVETLGATTLILTDKTGTLTENRMTVARYLLSSGDVEISEAPPPEGRAAFEEALRVGALCTNAELGEAEDGGTGDPMELALLRAARATEWTPEPNALHRVKEHAFDPETRMMATVHETAGGMFYTAKGAPESILNICESELGPEGPVPLSDDRRRDWKRRIESAAASGLRLLGLAEKRAAGPEQPPYEGLTLVGFACIADPLRPGVPPAIAACRNAGVRVVMVTGDHAATAAKIATDAGIRGDETPVVLGRELTDLDPDAVEEPLAESLRRASVFARVAPVTKLALVSFFQNEGQVVAMTGDGVNDAPALKKADIGVAMGQRGTQVAREAAHMVLKDDDFATIVEAIRQGRVIFANIRKFIVYLMSCNLCEVLVVALAVGAGLPSPLLPLQILFLNLVTDVFPAFALGLGQGDGQEMRRRPRNPDEPIVGRAEWAWIGLLGLLLTVATLTAFGLALFHLQLPPAEAVTVAFVTLALSQLWNVFNVRAAGTGVLRNDVIRNPFVWAALGLCTILTGLALWVPALSNVLRLPDPGTEALMLGGGLSFLPLVFGQACLWVLRLRETREVAEVGV